MKQVINIKALLGPPAMWIVGVIATPHIGISSLRLEATYDSKAKVYWWAGTKKYSRKTGRGYITVIYFVTTL